MAQPPVPDTSSIWLIEFEAVRLAKHRSWLDYALAATHEITLKPDRFQASVEPTRWFGIPNRAAHQTFQTPTGITLTQDKQGLCIEISHKFDPTLRIREPILKDGSNIPTHETAEQVLASSLARLREYTARASCTLTPAARTQLIEVPIAGLPALVITMLRAQGVYPSSWMLRIPSVTPYRPARDHIARSHLTFATPNGVTATELTDAGYETIMEPLPSAVTMLNEEERDGALTLGVEPYQFSLGGGDALSLVDEMKILASLQNPEGPFFHDNRPAA